MKLTCESRISASLQRLSSIYIRGIAPYHSNSWVGATISMCNHLAGKESFPVRRGVFGLDRCSERNVDWKRVFSTVVERSQSRCQQNQQGPQMCQVSARSDIANMTPLQRLSQTLFPWRANITNSLYVCLVTGPLAICQHRQERAPRRR